MPTGSSGRSPRPRRRAARPGAGDLAGREFAGYLLAEAPVVDRQGAVYRTRDAKVGGEVAVRVLARDLGAKESLSQRFIRDMVVTARLVHPAIPKIHRVGRDDEFDLHYAVLEPVDGTTLFTRVTRDGPEPPARCVETLRVISEALAAVHEQDLVHGDVCPRTLVAVEGGGIKLDGFGLPRSDGEIAILTPKYAPPEGVENNALDARSDIWSLGATAYFLLCGRPPFDANVRQAIMVKILTQDPEPLTAVDARIPAALWHVVQRMLARRPSDRYQSARDLTAALEGLRDGAVTIREADSTAKDDLASDATLKSCARVRHDGADRPTLGRLVLLSRIGRGGMGTVYRAVNPRVGTATAVKVLSRALVETDVRFVDRFVREARLAASLDSPHVVRVLDADHDAASGLHFLVMEYVEGPTAAGCARDAGGVLAEPGAVEVCVAACRGLAAAHARGIVHRDVKPENVLVPRGASGAPEFARAKLADLGLARVEAAGATLTSTGVGGMGTPGYMPPEQIRAAHNAGPAADVFAMGATLYALLAGRTPFDGESAADAIVRTVRGEYAPLSAAKPGVRPATSALVDACLSADPAARPRDAAELLPRLEALRLGD